MSTIAPSRPRSTALAWPRLALEPCVGLLVWVYLARQFAIRLGDPDLWGRLAVGQWFLAWGQMPTNDPFSYTPQLPLWVDHEWLTGVVFYALWANFGETGILLFKTALGLTTVLLAVATARLHTPLRMPVWLLLAITMPVFGYGMLPRAQLFTFALFALWLYLLERHRQGAGAGLLALLPISMTAWANLHGGFLAGLGLCGLYCAGSIVQLAMQLDRVRRACSSDPLAMSAAWRSAAVLALVCGASAAASLLNPYGLDYWRYLVDAITMRRPGIREWDPVPLSLGYAHFWCLAAAVVAALWIGRRGWLSQPALALVLLVTLVLAVRHARHMPLLATAACALTPGVLFTPQRLKRWPLLAGGGDYPAWMPAAVLAVAAFQGYGLAAEDGPWQFTLPADNAGVENMVDFPVAALDWAVAHDLRGNLATPFNWGEYALWRLWPSCKVAMDGRYETVYPHDTVEMVERFYLAQRGWRDLIDAQPTAHVLAPRSAPVNEQLAADPQWVQLYADAVAVWWSRRDRAANSTSPAKAAR